MKKIDESAVYRLIPCADWNKYHIYPTLSALRHLIFDAENNGFHKVIRRVGRKVLISEPDFFKWVEEQNEKN